MENSISSISEIRNLIIGVAENSGLKYDEAVAIIEKVLENVLFNKYDVFFDKDYHISATNKNNESDVKLISSVNDLKEIRQQIFLNTTEEKKEYITGLKSNISFRDIKDLISNEINKFGSLALYRQVSYLLHKHITGTVIAEIERGYIVNISRINKAGYIADVEYKYEVGEQYKFYVEKIKKDLSSGELKIILKSVKNKNITTGRSLIAKFRRSNGKLVKNKTAIIATRHFVRVYSVKNREVFYEKEFSDFNERTAAIITASSVFNGHKN